MSIIHPWHQLGYIIPHLQTDMDAYQFYNIAPKGMILVYPERDAIELEMDHPIFHTVFPITRTKNQMQCPNIGLGTESQHHGITYERQDAQDVHFKGIFDDKGRMMVFIAHNTDNGDGWEREGENEYYFKEFSEKRAYPLGINVIFYAMTH